MIREEFKELIESIGFKSYTNYLYCYKEFTIDLYNSFYDFYDFYNGSKWFYTVPYTDLTPINNDLKQELRSIKLKELLK